MNLNVDMGHEYWYSQYQLKRMIEIEEIEKKKEIEEKRRT